MIDDISFTRFGGFLKVEAIFDTEKSSRDIDERVKKFFVSSSHHQRGLRHILLKLFRTLLVLPFSFQ